MMFETASDSDATSVTVRTRSGAEESVRTTESVGALREREVRIDGGGGGVVNGVAGLFGSAARAMMGAVGNLEMDAKVAEGGAGGNGRGGVRGRRGGAVRGDRRDL